MDSGIFMDEVVFHQFRKLIYQVSGIHLTEYKRAMVSSRLQSRVRELGMGGDYGAYYQLLLEDPGGEEMVNMINRISTNVTQFFREPEHFNLLKTIFQRWEKDKRQSANLWCAAAASGEEPYTIAMLAREHLPKGFDLTIYASDISTEMLKMAQRGVYNLSKTKNIPRNLLHRYFQEGQDDASGFVLAKPILRKNMHFRQINLATPPFPIEAVLDVVFCRNVMIYFDQKTRIQVLQGIGKMIAAKGTLFLGLSENIAYELRKTWKSVAPSVFVLKPS